MPDSSQCFQTFCLVQYMFARHNGHWFRLLAFYNKTPNKKCAQYVISQECLTININKYNFFFYLISIDSKCNLIFHLINMNQKEVTNLSFIKMKYFIYIKIKYIFSYNILNLDRATHCHDALSFNCLH